MKTIKKINISTEMLFENHNVNANQEGDNKQVNGHTAIAGQKLKYALMNTISGINEDYKNDYIVSNGDGSQGDVSKDIGSDFRGYMITKDGSYSSRRTSPISTNYQLSKNASDFFEDTFVRFKINDSEDDKKHNDQRINNKAYSRKDVFNFHFSLDCRFLSTTKYFEYKNGLHIDDIYIKHVTEDERKRRARMFIKAPSCLSGFANQSRNAVDNKPQKVFISFTNDMLYFNFFDKSKKEQDDYLKHLDKLGDKYFIVDGESVSDGKTYFDNTYDLFEKAESYLDEIELIDYSDNNIMTQKEVADSQNYSSI